MALSERQFGAFKREHAAKGSVAWQMAAGGGGLQRDQAVARLAQSKPYHSLPKSGSLLNLMETLAPGSTTEHQRTARLN